MNFQGHPIGYPLTIRSVDARVPVELLDLTVVAVGGPAQRFEADFALEPMRREDWGELLAHKMRYGVAEAFRETFPQPVEVPSGWSGKVFGAVTAGQNVINVLQDQAGDPVLPGTLVRFGSEQKMYQLQSSVGSSWTMWPRFRTDIALNEVVDVALTSVSMRYTGRTELTIGDDGLVAPRISVAETAR